MANKGEIYIKTCSLFSKFAIKQSSRNSGRNEVEKKAKHEHVCSGRENNEKQNARDGIRTQELLRDKALNLAPLTWLGNPRTGLYRKVVYLK
jgi:hypothetical protein